MSCPRAGAFYATRLAGAAQRQEARCEVEKRLRNGHGGRQPIGSYRRMCDAVAGCRVAVFAITSKEEMSGMKRTIAALFACLLLASLVAPIASASPSHASSGAVRVQAVHVVRAGASGTAAAACSLGSSATQIFSSDSDASHNPNPVYSFPAGSGMFDLVSTILNWPGGDLVQDILLVANGSKKIPVTGIDYGVVPAGSYFLTVTFTYSNIPAGASVDWATRVLACQPSPVGIPLSNPPLPFHFQ